MNLFPSENKKPQITRHAGTRRRHVSECNVGDFVYHGDQVPGPMPEGMIFEHAKKWMSNGYLVVPISERIR
jgi:hypothetical protein